MKKQLMIIALAGLLIGPFANTFAGSIDKEDLQKMSANTMENKAWKNGQALVASLATLAALGTGFFGVQTALAANNRESIVIPASATAGLAVTTAGLFTGWFQIFKKRAERHGYKGKLLKFYFVDWMSQLDEQK